MTATTVQTTGSSRWWQAVEDPVYGPKALALLEQFPPRTAAATWPATEQSRTEVLQRLLAQPFLPAGTTRLPAYRAGVVKVLRWLESQPGTSWQERWQISGADAAGNLAWRELCSHGGSANARPIDPHYEFLSTGRGIMALICADVIRPSVSWLLTPKTVKDLPRQLARGRDQAGFAAIKQACADRQLTQHAENKVLSRIAVIVAAKGGLTRDITVGDCLELAGVLSRGNTHRQPGLQFYQALRAIGVFPPSAPSTVRMLAVPGQKTIEQMIDSCGIESQPIRDLLVDYLRERQPAIDYTTLRNLAMVLGRYFWRDLELHHPGICSLNLPPAVSAAWKERIRTREDRRSGQRVPRHAAIGYLAAVRTFYQDISRWALEEEARWGPWAVPSPIKDADLAWKKTLSRRKARVDARTRERMPVLPVLVSSADQARKDAAARLRAAEAVQPGQAFAFRGHEMVRAPEGRTAHRHIRAIDPATSARRDLSFEEHFAFWAWATVEVLRHTGIRVEELTELSHHSLVQYRLPATGELIPLLQIAPSKTDAERLLVISPELADVLSMIVSRVRAPGGAVPLVTSYDPHEHVWNPPMPLLFQRKLGMENRAINATGIRSLLDGALAATGLTGPDGALLRFTPHDFRRIFVTDAVMNGMPPHIAQFVCGHANINTTMGYKAVYPEEVITAHRAFIARRRATRPGEEYRTPTDAEWEEFLGHFERRKVAHGTCGRAYGTSCIHEHACLRCSLLRPDPAGRDRIVEVRDNLVARIAEAKREGWLGEVEGLEVHLAGAQEKLSQLDQIASRRTVTDLGIPTFADVAVRNVATS
jgi:integrase